MTDMIAVAGHSGSGKSTALRNLNPDETFVISVTGKPLPIPKFKANYKLVDTSSGKLEGNLYSSNNLDQILKVLTLIDKTRPEIKQIVIDDANYLMSFEVMDRAEEKG